MKSPPLEGASSLQISLSSVSTRNFLYDSIISVYKRRCVRPQRIESERCKVLLTNAKPLRPTMTDTMRRGSLINDPHHRGPRIEATPATVRRTP